MCFLKPEIVFKDSKFVELKYQDVQQNIRKCEWLPVLKEMFVRKENIEIEEYMLNDAFSYLTNMNSDREVAVVFLANNDNES